MAWYNMTGLVQRVDRPRSSILLSSLSAWGGRLLLQHRCWSLRRVRHGLNRILELLLLERLLVVFVHALSACIRSNGHFLGLLVYPHVGVWQVLLRTADTGFRSRSETHCWLGGRFFLSPGLRDELGDGQPCFAEFLLRHAQKNVSYKVSKCLLLCHGLPCSQALDDVARLPDLFLQCL